MNRLIACTPKTRKVIKVGSAPEIGMALREEIEKQRGAKRSTKIFVVERLNSRGEVVRTNDNLNQYIYHRRLMSR